MDLEGILPDLQTSSHAGIMRDIASSDKRLSEFVTKFINRSETRFRGALKAGGLSPKHRYQIKGSLKRLRSFKAGLSDVTMIRNWYQWGLLGRNVFTKAVSAGVGETGAGSEGLRWGSKHLYYGMPYEFSDWVKGDTELEKIYNRWSSWEKGYSKGRVSTPPPDTLLQEKAFLDLEFAKSQLDYFTNPQLLKWKEKEARSRIGFYKRIHPSTYSREFLSKMGFVYHKGSLYNIESSEIGSSIGRSISARKVMSEMSGDTDLTELIGDLGEELTGYPSEEKSLVRIIDKASEEGSSFGKKIVKRTGKATKLDLATAMADWEISQQKFITRTPVDKYMPTEAMHIAKSQSKYHYVHGSDLKDFFGELTGQSRFIRTSKGRVVLPGQVGITGRYLGNKWEPVIERIKKIKDSRKLIGVARNVYFHAFSELEGVNKLESVKKALVSMAGTKALLPEITRFPIIKNKKRFDRLKREFIRSLSKDVLWEKKNITGFDESREFLENLGIGEKVKLKGGVTGTVEYAEVPEHMAIKTSGGKVTSVSSILKRELRRNAKDTFPIRLVREPGQFPSSGKGKFYHDDWVTSIKTLSGTHIGYLERESAKSIATDISKGLLPVKNLYGKILSDERGVSLGLMTKDGGEYLPSSYRVSKKGLKEDIIEKILNKEAEIKSPKGGWEKFFKKKFPAKRVQIKKDIPDASGLMDSLKKIDKKYLVAGSLAVGGLLLYGATNTNRNRPITERDIPGSLYGSSAGQQQPGRVYEPRTRITQNNTGYNTELDVEADDMSGSLDHKMLASTMSSISSRALGTQRTNTSLHIIDSREPIGRESTRSRMNSYLS